MATQLIAINDFLIDVALKETHNFDSQVTEYPVESGSNITDNIRPLPITVEMECIVSNTPIGIIRDFRNNLLAEDQSENELNPTKPSDDAYDLLLRIRSKREPVTIRTSLRSYENMALKSLSMPRSKETGDALHFTATFQQIQTVENKRSIRVSPPNGRGHKKVSRAPLPMEDRLIKIDTYYREWFDPDYGYWRKSAEKVNTTFAPLSTFGPAGIGPKAWILYRSTKSPFGDNPQDAVQKSFLETAVSAGQQAITVHKRNIILVPIQQCELKGFFIFGNSTGFTGTGMWNAGLNALGKK